MSTGVEAVAAVEGDEACRRCWELSEEERDEGNCPVYAQLEGKTPVEIAAPQRVARAIISNCDSVTRPRVCAEAFTPKTEAGTIIAGISRGVKLLRDIFGESVVKIDGYRDQTQYRTNHEMLVNWCETRGGFASETEDLVSNWCVAGVEICGEDGPCALYENLIPEAKIEKDASLGKS